MSAEKEFGPYSLERPVARWTLAERFIASSSDNTSPLLLDRFWPELAMLERIEEEREAIRNWCRVNHPAVPKVTDVRSAPGAGFVVGEPFEGRALEGLLQRQRQTGSPLPRRLVIELGLQLAQALTAIHETTDEEGWSLGLVHGGVNPSRVILDKRGRVRLIGGWATRLEGRLAWSQPPRAVVYQAPERVWSMSPPTPRSDLFSLGVVLFEAWTLRRFEGSEANGIATLRRILRRSIEPPFQGKDAEGDIESLIIHLLQHDPEDRPKDAREVEATLSAILAARFEDARPAAPSKSPADPPSVELPKTTVQGLGSADPDMRATTLLEKGEVNEAIKALETASKAQAPEGAPQAEDKAPADHQGEEDVAATDLDGQGPPAPSETIDPLPEAPSPKEEAKEEASAAEELAPQADAAPPSKAPAPGPSPKAEAEPSPEAKSIPDLPKEPSPAPSPKAEAPSPEPSPAIKEQAPAKAPEGEASAHKEPGAADQGLQKGVTYTQEQEAVSPLVLQQDLGDGAIWGYLIHREGSTAERRYALSGESVTLGRSSDNNYQILREAKASRRHCEIKRIEDGAAVHDRRSTNGTYVNGQPVKEGSVKGGEKITIGYTTLKLILVDKDGNEVGAAQARQQMVQDETKPLPKAFLTRYRRTDKEEVIPVDGEVFMIGRSKDMDLVLKDKKVAPSHCQIRVEGNHYVIEDHLSEHGSLVNGFLIDQVILEGNEELRFGDQRFTFEVMI